MSELWLSLEEVKTVTGWTRWALRTRQESGELRCRRKKCRGLGRPGMEYAASSLPAEFQLKLARARIAAPEVQALAVRGSEPQLGLFGALFAGPPPIAESERLKLSQEDQEVAFSRLNAIAPMLDFDRLSNGHKPFFTASNGQTINSKEGLASFIATHFQTTRGTIWRWYYSFKNSGITGLAPRLREDKGTSKFFTSYPKAAALASRKYLTEQLSIRQVHEILSREWPSLYNHGSQPPAYKTLRSFLTSLPRPIAIMGREGERKYNDRCSPYLSTDIKSVRVNQIWVSDHCKHDVWLRNDCFPGLPKDAPVRPWVTAILDMRSRRIVSAVWNATPSSDTISSALRLAIREFGIPETFYIDNGKDYEKVGRIDLTPAASGVLVRLGIKPQYCLPKHPQSKLIESWFALMHKRFDTLWTPFYCGSRPDLRPENCELALKKHDAFLKGKESATSLMPASEFITLARQWIVDEYNAGYRAHSGKGMDGHTPNEVFDAELPPTRRNTPDLATLDALFWHHEKRRVSEGGCVQIFGQRYEPADPQSLANLFLLIERDVLIACDPTNLGEAVVMDLDGRFLGRLRAQKLVARGPVSHDQIKASFRMRRKIRRAVKDMLHFVSQGGETEIEFMRRRANLPATVDVTLPESSLSLGAGESEPAPDRPAFIDDVVADFLKE